MYRRSAPKVRDGKVQKKNNWQQSPNMFHTVQQEILVDRERPGRGYKHLLRKQDIRQFFSLIPDWQDASKELDGVFLGKGNVDYLGCYKNYVITLSAWDSEIQWQQTYPEFVAEHEGTLDLLGIETTLKDCGYYQLHFTEQTAKAFMLVHVFLHELGHHVDRVSSRRKLYCGRGEDYAESWALEREKQVYDNYCRYYRL